jgi:hypothetical protein
LASKDRINNVLGGYYAQFGHFPPIAQGVDADSDYYLDIVEQQTKNKNKENPGFHDGLSDDEDA